MDTTARTARRLKVGFPPYLRDAIAPALREVGLEFKVQAIEPWSRTVCYSATDEEERQFRSIAHPIIERIKNGDL